MTKKILITGGAGFIGSHLADLYIDRGHCVTVIDDLSTGLHENIHHLENHPNFTFIHHEIQSYSHLHELVSESDVIFNMAAMVGMFNVIEHPIKTLKVNMHLVDQLLSIITVLKKKPLLVVASSSEVYGSNPKAMREDDPLSIESAKKNHASYTISKLCNEITAMAYYNEQQLPVIIARIFNTVGPRQRGRYGMVVPRFVKEAMNNEPLTIYGDGTQTRSFCHVKHTCSLLHDLSENPESIGKIVNVGNDAKVSILQLAELVKKITHSSSTLEFSPFEEIFGDNYLIIHDRQPDVSLLSSLVGHPCHWDIDEAIEDVYRYYSNL